MADPSPQGRERRRAQRVALRADVDLESNDNFFSGQTRDISSGGLFIETRVALPIGSRLGLKLRLMGRTFEIESEVAWQLEDATGIVGVGVQFVKVSRVARAAIHTFMEQRAPLAFDELDPEDDVEEVDVAGEAPPKTEAVEDRSIKSPLPCPPAVPRPKARVVPPPLPQG